MCWNKFLAGTSAALVGRQSGYFNDASLIRPQNIIDVHPNLVKDNVWKQ
jgi:hypothetical protein